MSLNLAVPDHDFKAIMNSISFLKVLRAELAQKDDSKPFEELIHRI